MEEGKEGEEEGQGEGGGGGEEMEEQGGAGGRKMASCLCRGAGVRLFPLRWPSFQLPSHH